MAVLVFLRENHHHAILNFSLSDTWGIHLIFLHTKWNCFDLILSAVISDSLWLSELNPSSLWIHSLTVAPLQGTLGGVIHSFIHSSKVINSRSRIGESSSDWVIIESNQLEQPPAALPPRSSQFNNNILYFFVVAPTSSPKICQCLPPVWLGLDCGPDRNRAVRQKH